MNERSDISLLREYARSGSESAFEEVVVRHLGLVCSAANRQTGNPDLAKDIAQTVFTILARKAGRIPGHTIVAGWLVRTTRFVALRAVRSENSRRHREQEAARRADANGSASDAGKILPLLDQALSRMRRNDRDVLTLHYLEEKSLRDVARELGLSEEAAKKRAQRALERLRRLMGRRFEQAALVAVPAVSLALAPKAVSAAAVSQAAGSAPLSALANATLHAMKIHQWKITAAAVGCVLVAGIAVPAASKSIAAAVSSGASEAGGKSAPAPANLTRRLSVRVVDENGNPIPTATVEFSWGLVAGLTAGDDYGPVFLISREVEMNAVNADGVAELTLPGAELDAAHVDRVRALVRAPGYAFADAVISLANPKPVTLTRGTTLRVRVRDSRGQFAARPYVTVGRFQADKRSLPVAGQPSWERPEAGVIETHLPEGDYVIAGIDTGAGTFGQPRILKVRADGEVDLDFDADASVHVRGALDESVPRPVKNGKIFANVLTPALEDPGVKAEWQCSADIASDGTFDFGKMPEGELGIIAWCDGYVSLPTDGTKVVLVTPQRFPVATEAPITVKMAPDATLRVTVRDVSGNPVQAARIGLPLTQNMDNFNAWDYRNDAGNTLPMLRSRVDDPRGLFPGAMAFGGADFKTDKDGQITITGLPLITASVYASHPVLGRAVKSDVELRSGEQEVELTLNPVPDSG